MANIIYNIAKQQIFNGTMDLDGDTFRVALLETSAGQDVTHTTVAAVLAADDELTDVAGTREQLVTPAVRVNVGESRAEWYDSGANYVEWSDVDQVGSEQCVAYLVYKFDTDDATSVPVLMVDSFAAITPNGSDIRLTWHADGIMHSG